MLPAVHLLTAPGRAALLAGTLASWDRGDWGGRPVIHVDAGRAATAAERIPAAWCAMLRAALAAGDSAHLLLLEDDLAFVPGLRAALLAWPPLAEGRIATLASLYDPGLPEERKAEVGRAEGGCAGWFCSVFRLPPSAFRLSRRPPLLLRRAGAAPRAALCRVGGGQVRAAWRGAEPAAGGAGRRIRARRAAARPPALAGRAHRHPQRLGRPPAPRLQLRPRVARARLGGTSSATPPPAM